MVLKKRNEMKNEKEMLNGHAHIHPCFFNWPLFGASLYLFVSTHINQYQYTHMQWKFTPDNISTPLLWHSRCWLGIILTVSSFDWDQGKWICIENCHLGRKVRSTDLDGLWGIGFVRIHINTPNNISLSYQVQNYLQYTKELTLAGPFGKHA